MTQLHWARVKAGTRAGDKAKNRTSRSRRNLHVRSRLEPSSPGCRSRQRRTTKRMVCGPKGAAKEKWAERGNTLPRFSAARGYRRGHGWRLASSGVGVAAGGRRRGGSPRLAAQTADFFLRGRTLDPAEAMQTVGLEPELEGDG